MLFKGGAYKFVRDGVANFKLLLAKSTNDFLPVLPTLIIGTLKLKISTFLSYFFRFYWGCIWFLRGVLCRRIWGDCPCLTGLAIILLRIFVIVDFVFSVILRLVLGYLSKNNATVKFFVRVFFIQDIFCLGLTFFWRYKFVDNCSIDQINVATVLILFFCWILTIITAVTT